MTNVSSTDFPHHYPYEDHSWSLIHFRDNLRVEFVHNHPFDSCFSLVGIDASTANAFRRILLAEIPTLAIEDVFMFNNTSIVQDEVLAHRLGLIPLKGNRKGLRWMRWYRKPSDEDPIGTTPSDYNTAVLELDVSCGWAPNAQTHIKNGDTDPDKIYEDSNVYAKQIVFVPHGQQEHYFKDEPIEPVHPDILIAKMRPGQAIKCRMHCVKGIGADHAKFSPVATASYRLKPSITITQPILGSDARKFARCFPRGVINLSTVTADDVRRDRRLEGHDGEMKAEVGDTMKDTVSRECLRHDEFKDKVKLGRYRDHFIFSIESTGQWDSDELFLESVRCLKVKCQRMKRGLDALMR